jgi:hypothetical protein
MVGRPRRQYRSHRRVGCHYQWQYRSGRGVFLRGVAHSNCNADTYTDAHCHTKTYSDTQISSNPKAAPYPRLG